MKYRHLGKSGLQSSELSFGAWVTFAQQIDTKTAEKLMTIAYDSGVNFFDNAEAYASGKAEIMMGDILKRRGWPRDTFVQTLLERQLDDPVMQRIETILTG
jgi:aryl-alcohol dehydrogenase-like predicted oxidoreductase